MAPSISNTHRNPPPEYSAFYQAEMSLEVEGVTLKDLNSDLFGMRAKWRTLAMLLNVNSDVILENMGTNDCNKGLTKTLEEWMQSGVNVTLNYLIDQVGSRVLGHGGLAKQLKLKYSNDSASTRMVTGTHQNSSGYTVRPISSATSQEQRITSLESQLTASSQKIEYLSTQLSNAKAETIRVKSELGSLKGSFKQMFEENNRLQQKLKLKNNLVDDLRDQLGSMSLYPNPNPKKAKLFSTREGVLPSTSPLKTNASEAPSIRVRRLEIKDLLKLYNASYACRAHWRVIGLKLGIIVSDLDALDYLTSLDDKLEKVISKYVNTGDATPEGFATVISQVMSENGYGEKSETYTNVMIALE